MILQSIRPALLSALAIFFGVAQIFCVCANAQAATPNHDTYEMHQDAGPSFGLAHSILTIQPDAETKNQHDDGHNHNGDHEHAADCAHCNDANVLIGANDVISPITLPSPADEDFLAPAAQALPITRALMAPSALDGLRWLHPPAPTLVSLKIRLTI